MKKLSPYSKFRGDPPRSRNYASKYNKFLPHSDKIDNLKPNMLSYYWGIYFTNFVMLFCSVFFKIFKLKDEKTCFFPPKNMNVS
jgi:hypothetical protein